MSISFLSNIDRWLNLNLLLWRRQLRRTYRLQTNIGPQEIKEIATGVRMLSSGLTGERLLAGTNYMDNPELLGAYLMFYWPVSYAQAVHAMSYLPHKPRSVLDLGSGPAPVTFAALDQGAQYSLAADRSDHALKLALELGKIAKKTVTAIKWDPLKNDRIPDGTFDLITMGHVLNELWNHHEDGLIKKADMVESACSRLSAKGSMLIIEPALLLTSRGLLALRDELVKRRFPVIAPCLHRGNCPALAREANTCHLDRGWEQPEIIRQISKAAGLNKDALKMSFLIVGRKGSDWPRVPEGRIFKIVSEHLVSNKRIRLIGCGPEGRKGVSLMEKNMTDGNRVLLSLKRGDVIRLGNVTDREGGISISAESSIELISRTD